MINLPMLPFLKQYPMQHGNPSPFVIKDDSLKPEELANSLVDQIRAESLAGLQLGKADDVPYLPGQQAVLRVIRADRIWHRAKADVLLRSQPNGLYVELDTAAESPLLYLKFVVHSALFVALWLVGMWLYFHIVNPDGLFVVFAQKYGGGATREVLDMLKGGWCFERGTGTFTQCSSGASWFSLFRMDPALFMSYMMIPMGIVAGLIALMRKQIPTSLLYRPCQYLDWPTPQEFDAFVTHHAAWMQSLLSAVLVKCYGIEEQHIQRLNR